MSISGLIITLTEQPTESAIAIQRLSADGRFTLGRRERYLLPAVLEARSDFEAEEAVRWLTDVPGVLKVDVVYVRFAEDAEEAQTRAA
jgi:nitrate reductase NapAB chaperone NapD